MKEAIVILAAGKGTRMRASVPNNKVLQPLCGVPLLGHLLRTIRKHNPARCVLVVGMNAEAVIEYACAEYANIEIAYQHEQKGTGDAVKAAKKLLQNFSGQVTILLGDVPFLSSQTLEALSRVTNDKTIGLLGFETKSPTGYGRLVRNSDGAFIEKIIEEKECTADERTITLCNSGILSASSTILFTLLDEITPNNVVGEYYLTDIVALACKKSLKCGCVVRSKKELIGINSRHDLIRAEQILQEKLRADAIDKGAFLCAPETIFLAPDTDLSADCVVEPHVVFGANVKIATGARICAFSYLEGCEIGENAQIGPYARVRPDTSVGKEAKVGNFVEIKNTHLGAGAKSGHLSYIGDSVIGKAANIGAGTITCNYDGVMKHNTTIGAHAFIGSNTVLIAPVTIGDNAVIGAGSVIVQDISADSLALSRVPQTEYKGFAKRYFMRLKKMMNGSHKNKNEKDKK